jgi:SAM-dependent methyltransferase
MNKINPPVRDISKRVANEKSFHNGRFIGHLDPVRSSKYYLALQYWYIDYYTEVTNLSPRRVLEIGSGVESLALQIDQADFEFESIDISEEAIAHAKSHAKLKHANFSVDDAHKTQFADCTFDLIIGRGILHHLDLSLACEEIKRLLEPGGKVVFGEPLDCNVFINFYRKLTPNIRSRDERPLSMEDLNMLSLNFGEMRVVYYGFLTLGPSIFRLKSPQWLHDIDAFLLNNLGLGRFLAWACLITSKAT